MTAAKPSHTIKLVYWFDHKTQLWRATVTYTEHRCGQRYGEPVIDDLTGTANESSDHFMARVRLQVIERINLFWT